MGRVLALAVLIAPVDAVFDQLGATATATVSPPPPAACAELIAGESNGWHDQGTGQDRFSVKVGVRDWQDGGRVTLAWSLPVSIEHAYGVTLADGGGEPSL